MPRGLVGLSTAVEGDTITVTVGVSSSMLKWNKAVKNLSWDLVRSWFA